jgi:hypothetical protein
LGLVDSSAYPDLTIQNANAIGATAVAGGGGGAGGLGGAIYVDAGTVNLSGMAFSGNRATGGNGNTGGEGGTQRSGGSINGTNGSGSSAGAPGGAGTAGAAGIGGAGGTGDGNDLAIVITAVPEASAFVMLGAVSVGAVGIVAVRRARS